MKRKKILFFISGPKPSPSEVKEAEALGAAFRNANLIRKTDNPEECDEVFGKKIPEPYKEKTVAKLPESFKAEGDEDAERAEIEGKLEALGVKFRAGSKLETLKAKLAEAEGADPTA